jgi:hypothetical protein
MPCCSYSLISLKSVVLTLAQPMSMLTARSSCRMDGGAEDSFGLEVTVTF